MKRNEQAPDEAWETDAVWKLLDMVPAAPADSRFVDDVVRAARVDGPPKPWWHKFLSPAPIIGFASATVAVVLCFSLLKLATPHAAVVVQPPHKVPAESFGDIQVAADQEMLLAASDRLDEISDGELVSLLGY